MFAMLARDGNDILYNKAPLERCWGAVHAPTGTTAFHPVLPFPVTTADAASCQSATAPISVGQRRISIS